MERATSSTAHVSTVAEDIIITRSCVVRVYAQPRTITLIVGANVSIIGTGCACCIKAILSSFLTGVVAFWSADTWVSCMNGTASTIAGVRTVAEDTIITKVVIIWVAAAYTDCTYIVSTTIAV